VYLETLEDLGSAMDELLLRAIILLGTYFSLLTQLFSIYK
jgi:hypothetical protein